MTNADEKITLDVDGQDGTLKQKLDLESGVNKQKEEGSSKGKLSRGESFSTLLPFRATSTLLLTSLILFLGLLTSGAFLVIGITGALQTQADEFDRSASDTVNKVKVSFEDYVTAALLVHARCRHRDFTRREFRELHEYLVASGLRYKAVQFDPNITHAERPAAEAEASEYYAENYPHVDYQGFRGFNTPDSTTLEPRTNQSFYFPIHYQEPIESNEAAIDLDYHSSESRMRAVYSLFDNQSPSLTDRLSLVREAGQRSRCGDHDGPSYGVVLMHPGVELEDPQDVWPRDFSTIVICIPDLIQRSTSESTTKKEVYIHDLSHPGGEPVFMGAAFVNPVPGEEAELTFLDEIELSELSSSKYSMQTDVPAANRVWTITVVDVENRYDSNILFVTLGGVIILFSSIFLAFWVRTSDNRNRKFNQMRSQAESEKAALILQNARQATKTERELNDFIAHEVRNPVAAAMAACNFVKVELNQKKPLPDEEALDQAREDINIIDNSLHFVNDLLRNMLDMHRAASKQLQVTMAPTDLLHDILEPVAGMLYRRGSKIKLIVDCPDNMWVMADALRLKQVILNLGRNSSKFIDEGFIRLKAEEVDGNVRMFVDDSGSGIPIEKRERLFAKFQESLDLLSQGTGIGLFLCKSLVELMGGRIYLDDDYFSGIEGHPGTRFVVDLQAGSIESPMLVGSGGKELEEWSGGSGKTQGMDEDMKSISTELPTELKILFVDDDAVLRKLFTRSIKIVCPEWEVRQAANGETALRLTETEHFDVIFIDMYMASVEKQLLGTETVSHLRNQGVTSRICGLSANDKEQDFYDAGADSFMFKPFPCDKHAMISTLCRVLYEDHKSAYDGGYSDEY